MTFYDYDADFTLTLGGTYTITAHLSNAYTSQDGTIPTEINGSPDTVTVYPGAIDPLQCYTNVASPTIPFQASNTQFDFTINFADSWGNLHTTTISGVTVTSTATYNNLFKWGSSIGVPDYPDGL